jgi:sugar/nucleoside kinase (ribokinase family)
MALPAAEILCIGALAYDTIILPDRTLQHELGGSAVYFALGAAPLAKVLLVGVVGADFRPEDRRRLQARGIDLAGLATSPHPTLHWTGRYSRNLDHRECLGRVADIFDDYTPQVPTAWRNCRTVFLAADAPHLQTAALRQLTPDAFVAADTMDIFVRHDRDGVVEVLRSVDLFLINEDEARTLTGAPDAAAAGRRILAMGAPRVIVKCGSQGSLFLGSEEALQQRAWPLEAVIDPTGAGDAFAGGVMSVLATREHLNRAAWRQALCTGTAVASFACAQGGAKSLETLRAEDVECRQVNLRDGPRPGR